jgi:hypothetical protein
MTGPAAALNARLVDDMARLHNLRARARIAELEQAIVAATEHRHATRTRASYEDTLAAGYIDLLDTA